MGNTDLRTKYHNTELDKDHQLLPGTWEGARGRAERKHLQAEHKARIAAEAKLEYDALNARDKVRSRNILNIFLLTFQNIFQAQLLSPTRQTELSSKTENPTQSAQEAVSSLPA